MNPGHRLAPSRWAVGTIRRCCRQRLCEGIWYDHSFFCRLLHVWMHRCGCGEHVFFGSHSLVCRCETVRVAFAEISQKVLYGPLWSEVTGRVEKFFIFWHSLTSKLNLFDEWFRNWFLKLIYFCGEVLTAADLKSLPMIPICPGAATPLSQLLCSTATRSPPAPASYMSHDNQCVSWPASDSLRDAGCLIWIFSFPSMTDSLFPV